MYQNYSHLRRFFDATTLINSPLSGERSGAVARVDLGEKEVERRPIDIPEVVVMCDGLWGECWGVTRPKSTISRLTIDRRVMATGMTCCSRVPLKVYWPHQRRIRVGGSHG